MLNTKRFLYNALYSIAKRKGYNFSTRSYGWIIEIRDKKRIFRTNGYVFDINPPSGVLGARDKYATHTMVSEIIDEKYLIPSAFLPCLWKEEFIGITKKEILEDFLKTYAFPLIIKDLRGAQGRDVFRIDNENELSEKITYFETLGCDALISPYIFSDTELRIILLDGEAHLAYYKKSTKSWKFNLSEGAHAIPIHENEYDTIGHIIDMAKNITAHLGLRFVSCDFFILPDGSHRFLEINAGVSVDHFVELHPDFSEKMEHMYELAMEKSFHFV